MCDGGSSQKDARRSVKHKRVVPLPVPASALQLGWDVGWRRDECRLRTHTIGQEATDSARTI